MKALGYLAAIVLIAGVFVLFSQLQKDDGPVVVCYTALDEEFSRPIVEQFEKDTGIRVKFLTDTESSKSVGLTARLMEESRSGNPQCDVFWNNEAVNTIRLKKKGVLASYHPEAAKSFPATFRDPDGTWTGFAARARVLIVNTDKVKPEEMPRRMEDLLDPRWKGQIGIAKPMFGSTATWVTVLQTQPEAKTVLQTIFEKQEPRIMGGNKGCAQIVGRGGLSVAFTDTDDAVVEKESGKPVEIIYLDAARDQRGTLFFPNTLSMIQNCPHPEAAKQLIEYLLAPRVEELLAKGPSAQIPVNPAVKTTARVATPNTIKAMPVDWSAVAEDFDKAMEWVQPFIK